jgi:opacity protein-like surface antigen
MIRTFSPLSRGRCRDYSRAVRALRNAAVIAVAVLAIASAAALAVASGGGSARGDAGQGQYGAKPDCRANATKHSQGCPKTYSGRSHHP